jgi:uncharacterized protein (DUF1697 family)
LKNIGFTQVRTYIQSGNVVLESNQNNAKAIASEIADAVMSVYRFKPHVIVLTAAGLQNSVKRNPFSTGDGKALHFYFLESLPQEPKLEIVMKLKADSEEYEITDNVFYLFAPEGIGRSKLAANVEKCLGVPVTARNWNTVNKLLSMVNE